MRNGNAEVLELLIKYKANVNYPNMDENTPLHSAVLCEDILTINCITTLDYLSHNSFWTAFNSLRQELWNEYISCNAKHASFIIFSFNTEFATDHVKIAQGWTSFEYFPC